MKIDETKKVIDVVKDVGKYMLTWSGKQISAENLLEQFLFPAQQQHQRAYTLSGWEKRRLHLLSILIQNPNFLILDEPTNDLDIETLNILEEFLIWYKWCLVIVSHDRFFMDTVVDHLLVFEGEWIIREFPGNYSEWKAVNEGKMDVEELEKKWRHSELVEESPESSTPSDLPFDPQTKKQLSQKRKSLSNKERAELKKVNQKLETLETRKKELHELMTQHATDHEKMTALWLELSTVTNELRDVEERWLELNE
jgi:ATP-binding cassette subfamily F protein uup